MLKPISESKILKRYSQHKCERPEEQGKQNNGNISVFPNAPFELPSETFVNSLNKHEKNRKELHHWIQRNFREDIDWGRIHISEACKYARAGSPNLCRDISHYSQPTLFKAGAERIIGVLGLGATFPGLKQYEMACVHKQEISNIILKCELKTPNGTVVGEGAGARNIKQDNYRLNISIKMALKSALVDTVIRFAGLSGVFIKTHQKTLSKLGGNAKNDVPGTGVCKFNKLPGQRSHPYNKNSAQSKLITQRQQNYIDKLSGELGLTIEALEKRCKSSFNSPLKYLKRHQASQLIHQLNEEF